MEPFTAANSFATVVGLISIYKQERKESNLANKDDFLSWLSNKKLDVVRDKLLHNQSLLISIEDLLCQSNEALLQKLDDIDQLLAKIAGRLEGFGTLQSALYPTGNLSNQSIQILKELVESGGSELRPLKRVFVLSFKIVDGPGEIQCDDQRFLQDDMDALCSLGFLTHYHTPQNSERYRLTRSGMQYIQMLDRQEEKNMPSSEQ